MILKAVKLEINSKIFLGKEAKLLGNPDKIQSRKAHGAKIVKNVAPRWPSNSTMLL
jgi:hypothetical protein